MVILGIDPGLAKMGYGIVSVDEREEGKALAYGCLRTPKTDNKGQRLCYLYDRLMELFEKYKPDVLSLESLFFNRNTKTALTVGEARGIALLAAGKNNVPVVEFTPLQVKECLAGFGRAKKDAVADIVRMELDLGDEEMPVDASDALGIAICYYRMGDLE